MVAEDSSGAAEARSRYCTGGTSTWRSMRSSNGPEIRLRYFFTSRGEQLQVFSGWPRWPQGQGFIAPTNISRAGNVTDIEARAIVTTPSSSGWRKTSRTWRRNSGNSSKKSTPLWASDTSPGIGTWPPLISPASDMVWWGARNGRVVTNAVRSPVRPATRWMRVISMASAKVMAGWMVVRRRANIDVPAPGGHAGEIWVRTPALPSPWPRHLEEGDSLRCGDDATADRRTCAPHTCSSHRYD